MEHTNLLVTMEREKPGVMAVKERVVLVFRADDLAQSVRNGKLRWGGGRVWTVVKIEAAN